MVRFCDTSSCLVLDNLLYFMKYKRKINNNNKTLINFLKKLFSNNKELIGLIIQSFLSLITWYG